MSHRIGTIQTLPPGTLIGPDAGPATSLNRWLFTFAPPAPPGGSLFVILHFTGASFPANNRLEVKLGYDTDRFTAADGPDFWTRPVQLAPDGTVAITYITDGAGTGRVTLAEFGRGEKVESGSALDPSLHNLSNPDIFLLSSPYEEPFNETRGICGGVGVPPNWENVACYPPGVEVSVARSVCLFICAEINHDTGLRDLSSCTGTLIGPDLVLCAGHCATDPANLNIVSGSVCFGFETNCDRTKPQPYAPRFFKVQRALRAVQSNPSGAGGLDYALLQLKSPVPGIPAVPMRSDPPALKEAVFEVHHPAGITKKVSPSRAGTQAQISSIRDSLGFKYLFANTDLAGGSSGSALFDMAGRVIGVADMAGMCSNGFLSITEVLKDIASTPPSAIKRDVMLVLDRSGSMSTPAGTGRTKIAEAHEAASLFVRLIRSAGGDRIGVVSFSTQASSPVDFAIHAVDDATKNALVAPGGVIQRLVPDGLTSIGGGLRAANGQFPAPAPGVNKRTILLLTDGLQNTPPMIAETRAELAGADLSVIGFGEESSLDGFLLDTLAQEHNGMYTRAGSPLHLKKFFALAFGNIFESGTLVDPDYVLPAADRTKAISFGVCSEDSITAVLGWDSDRSLEIQLKTPNGTVVNPGSPGTDFGSGRGWRFLRVPLPFNGARDGTWQAIAGRSGGGEIAPADEDIRFFLNVVVKGGPKLVRQFPDRRHYTGDTINPRVLLRNSDGTTPRGAEVKLFVTKPSNGAGNVLTQAGLGQATLVGGDVMPARQSTLLGLEAASGQPAISYLEETIDLFDDGAHDDGAMEPDGIFGLPLPNLLNAEGSYSFRAVATYGDNCISTREALWSLHIEVGIDPAHTDVTTNLTGTGPGGKKTGTITIHPHDSNGNSVGPGKGDGITVTGGPGTTVTGPPQDNGDGSYTVPVAWDPGTGQGPSVVISQPGRPPVVVQPKQPSESCFKWKLAFWLLLLLLLILILLFLLLK
jgi:hypothetical protein